MSSNALKVLNQILGEQRTQIAPDWNDADFFELFAARQVLRSFALDPEEIESGLVDASADGGIDGFYVIVFLTSMSAREMFPRQRKTSSPQRGGIRVLHLQRLLEFRS